MVIWANLLHFYQPPTQKKYWVDRITNEAYRRIFEELRSASNARLSLNVSPLLFEFWERYDHADVTELLKELIEEGKVELTSSAKYHPLLPRLPKDEIIRQIKLADETSRHYLGDLYHPRGFFPPEMAYHPDLAPILEELGFEWVVVEELSFARDFGKVDYSKIYQVEGTNLKIFFRERGLSFKILSGQLGTEKLFLDDLGPRPPRSYVLTAMDGETFGHHRPGMEKVLGDLYGSKKIKSVALSDLLPPRPPTGDRASLAREGGELFPSVEAIKTYPSTWALMERDVEKNIPFARWEDPGNEIHAMQWRLTDLAVQTVNQSKYALKGEEFPISPAERDPARGGGNFQFPINSSIIQFSNPKLTGNSKLATRNFGRGEEGLTSKQRQWLVARGLLDRSLHSDQYWWASARPWWSLEMIEGGAKELLDSIYAVPDAGEAAKKRAHELYFKIITTGFEWQKKGIVEELARKEDEEIRMLTDAAMPTLPKAEIEKMISNIERELNQVVGKQEFERAAQLRNRIAELKSYIKE